MNRALLAVFIVCLAYLAVWSVVSRTVPTPPASIRVQLCLRQPTADCMEAATDFAAEVVSRETPTRGDCHDALAGARKFGVSTARLVARCCPLPEAWDSGERLCP